MFWVNGVSEYSRGVVEIPRKRGGMCFVYPTSEKCFLMIGTKSYGKILSSQESFDELHKVSKDYPESIQRMIATLKDPKDLFHDELRYVEMPLWYKGRAIIIGDAKHAASPITGMGASMALEDAYVLAEELKKNFSSLSLKVTFDKFVDRRDKRIKRFRRLCHRSEGWLLASGLKLWFRKYLLEFIPMSFFTRPIDNLLSSKL